jgi:hypothetical protein
MSQDNGIYYDTARKHLLIYYNGRFYMAIFIIMTQDEGIYLVAVMEHISRNSMILLGGKYYTVFSLSLETQETRAAN